jgi:glycosyltransferase involved in cell wall biosynthesis
MTENVFIGIPCYNRSAGLQRTIDCLVSQTHRNWTALISDNASPDPGVMDVAKRACDADKRFTYHCQPSNVGAAANFRFVAERADAPYFMWASDDDIWEPNFIDTCLGLLVQQPAAAMAFGTIDNINQQGAVIRTYPGFSRFTSDASHAVNAWRFLRDPEIMGKANLIYGLYRTDALQRSIADVWDAAGFDRWGGDMVFLFGFLCRYPIVASDEVILHKRSDTREGELVLEEHPRSYFLEKNLYASYRARYIAMAPTGALKRVASIALTARRFESTLLQKWSRHRRRWHRKFLRVGK